MLHKPFRDLQKLTGFPSYTLAYANFLHSRSVPPSLEDDIYRLEQQSQEHSHDNTNEHDESDGHHTTNRAMEE